MGIFVFPLGLVALAWKKSTCSSSERNEDEVLVPGELGHPTRKRDTRLPSLVDIKYTEVQLQQCARLSPR